MSDQSSVEGDSVVGNSPRLSENVTYSDQIYINAARIFQSIYRRKPPDRILVSYGNDSGLPLPVFKDEKSQRWSYELAYSALKYQDLLETILLVSGFYHSQPLPDEMTSLVVVMLYDFQDRKFQPRAVSNKDEVIEDVREIEAFLYSYKTKLAAALAKCRIKHAAPTIDYILPETVRKQEQRAFTVPLYAWINAAKTSFTEVFNTLKREGFTKVDLPSDLHGNTYCVDEHCQDLLVFPAHLKEELNTMEMFIDLKLIIQDKSLSLAAHSVKALHNMDGDIIVANPCSGFTIAHLSVLTNHCACNIFVCGVKSESRDEELQELFRNMECKNIKMLKESFTDIEPSDVRLQKAKLILLLPQCSVSGIGNPVDFILNEHGDTSLLQDLSQGSVQADKLSDLAKQQLSEINHAMKFSKVQAIVYCTCSVYEEENEEVINQALQFKMEGIKGQTYRLSPPVVPISSSQMESALHKFLKLEPSDILNGCFLAVLTREVAIVESLSPQDILARAASKGLLNGIGVPKSPKKDEKRRKSKVPLHRTILSTANAQEKVNDFINRENLMSPRAATLKHDQASPQKNLNYTLQSRKPQKQSGIPIMSMTMKKPNNLFSLPIPVRPKPEDKMIVLKPVQIMLPPVTLPFQYSPSPTVKIRSPIHYHHQRWHSGARSYPQNSFNPAMSAVGKTKESTSFTAVWHPKPWH